MNIGFLWTLVSVNHITQFMFPMQNNLKKRWFFIQMDKKGVELPQSMVVTILILILFLIVMFALYALWRGQALQLIDRFFELFGR